MVEEIYAEQKLDELEHKLHQIKCDLECGIPKITNSYTTKSIVDELLQILKKLEVKHANKNKSL